MAPPHLGGLDKSIPVDFSVNCVTPLFNSAIAAECGSLDTRARSLILVVRRWAKDRGISHAAKGHLPPYAWTLLTVYFLRTRDEGEGPLLPAVQHFEALARLLVEA